MKQEKYLAIEKALQLGHLSEALTLLVSFTQDQEKSIREDAALLQSKFEYNRNQYELKGILTDQEFNIHFSKTALGLQDILGRIRRGQESTTASGSFEKFDYRPIYWFIGILFLITAGWFLWPKSSAIAAEANQKKDDTTASVPFKQVTDVSKITEPTPKPEQKSEPIATTTPSLSAAKPPPVGTDVQTKTEKVPPPIVEEVEKPPAPPPVQTFTVSIIRNSDMSDADIYVDGQLATILSESPIITTVQVFEKNAMHQFELRKSGENLNCKKRLLVTQDNQKITFNCN